MYIYPMKPITLYMTEKQLASLKKLAVKTGLKTAEHVRRAVDMYLIDEFFTGKVKDNKQVELVMKLANSKEK